MSEIAALIHEHPWMSFALFLSLIWAIEASIKAVAQRNRPIVECNCKCCESDDEEEES